MITKIIIQELTAPGCSHCVSAKQILEQEVKPNFPKVEVEYIDILSEKGQELVQKFAIMALPGIIVNGELFSTGALDKEKLVEKIKLLD